MMHQPGDILAAHRRLVEQDGSGFLRPYFERAVPSSVEGLRVNGPDPATLHELTIAPGVRAHSIIATRPEKQADCLITVESDRLTGGESGKMVECPHTLCPENPTVIDGVRRILQAHQARPRAA